MTKADLPFTATRIMGVINITPDSFSDGGRYASPDEAVAQTEKLVEDGADWLDLGAESTRPGAKPVSEDEEWRRLEPVLRRLMDMRLGSRVSVDTRKPSVMLRAAEMGCAMVNSVAGAPSDEGVLARLGAFPGLQFLAMHMHGEPETMQARPLAGMAAVADVDAFFVRTKRALLAAGFAPEAVWLDPGIGFGKDDGANVALMAEVPRWSKDHQTAIGISRKGFLSRVFGVDGPPAARDSVTKALELGLIISGAKLIRTHDVRRLRHLLSLPREIADA